MMLASPASVGIGALQGYCTTTLILPKELRLLCRKALERGIQLRYTRALIKTGYLHEPQPPLELEDWPWPVKVYACGSFSVLKDDQRIRFDGKAQRKPMELLKVLIALGGDGVPANKLIELLWSGSLAGDEQKALEVTLHRLRKLLGHDKAIQVSDRRVSLNHEMVWVDLWALEHWLSTAIPGAYAMELQRPADLERAAPAIMRLYRGHVLDGEAEAGWLLAVRNRLHGRFNQFVMRLGENWETVGEWARAAELYERAVELDALAEAFYCRLMVCLREQGRRTEAIEVFRRCRQMLAVTLGVQPSAPTEAVFRELAGN